MADNLKRVKFKGQEYWLVDDDPYKILAPLDHFNDNGNLQVNPFDEIGYAVVINGLIIRFNQVIGEEHEIEWPGMIMH